MAVAWVECRCTTAPASGRDPSTARCRNTSFEGLSPPTCRQEASSLLIRSGSSRPRQELVGVISTPPPSGRRTLMLPAEPTQ